MNWLQKIFGTTAPPVVDVPAPAAVEAPVIDFATATVDELTAYNQALDNEVRAIQARRALVAERIDAKLTGV
jgi:hypothetical protein